MKFKNYLRSYETSALTSSKVFKELAEKDGFVVKSLDTLPTGDTVSKEENEYLRASDHQGNVVGEYVELIHEFDQETWELFPGAEGWETEDGRELPPFYRLIEGHYVIGNNRGIQFIGENEEISLITGEIPRITVKLLLKNCLNYFTLADLIRDYPQVKEAL